MRRVLIGALVAGVAGCVQPRTEVWLEVSTDLAVPSEIDRVSITVSRSGRGAWPFTTTHELGIDQEDFPLSLGLIPDDERDLSLDVRVVGLAGTKPVVTRTIQTSFLEGETRVLAIALSAACRGGVCLPEAVDPRALPRFGETAPPPTGHQLAVALTDAADTPVVGAPSDLPPVRYPCPAGAVVTGFDVELEQGLVGRLQMSCARPEITSTMPVELTLSPVEPVSAGSVVGAAAISRRCPPDQVVVGFDGRSGLLLDQLAFRCAPLVGGDVTNLTPVGGDGGAPMPRTECEPGMMARGVIVSQGAWLERIGLACTRMELR